MLDDTTQPQLVAQPIVDLHRGVVVGHEVLSRFPRVRGATPDKWFAAAAREGLGAELNARVFERAVALRAALPPNTFLTVNVDPEAVGSSVLEAAVTRAGGLERLVVEITEHSAFEDVASVVATLDAWRDRGAKVALDDVGSGYAGLQALLRLRPDIVKVDREIVADMDRDPAKRAVVRMLGDFAGGLDAWLLAEGLERAGELEECVNLAVPLAQGYLLGRPSVGWTRTVDPRATAVIARLRDDGSHLQSVVRLLEDTSDPATTVGCVATVAEGMRLVEDPGPIDTAVVLSQDRLPVTLCLRPSPGAPGTTAQPLLVKGGEEVRHVARRCVARASGTWHHPVILIDDGGRYLGVVRVERLLDTLAG